MNVYQIIKYSVAFFFGGLALILTAVAFYNAAPIHQDTRPPSQWKLSKLDVIRHLKNGDYELLDRQFTELHGKFEAGTVHWQDISDAFDAFNFRDPTLHSAFADWINAKPKSFIPYLARGLYLSDLGYAYRGTGFTNTVHPDQMNLMVKHLRLGTHDLKKAIEINAAAVAAYERIMSISMITGDQWGVWQTYLIGYYHAPDATSLTQSMGFALQPKWGGDSEVRFWFQRFAMIAGFIDPGFRIILEDEKYIEADTATTNGQYKSALGLWSKIMATNKSAHIRYRRASVLRQLDRDEEALKDILIAIRKDPDFIDALRMAASIFASSKSPEKALLRKALPHYEAALRLSPYHPETLVRYAHLLTRLQRHGEAIEAINKAEFFGNWSPYVQLYRARLLRSPLGRVADSKKAYIRRFEVGPPSKTVLTEFTRFLQISKDCDYFLYAQKALEMCLRDQSCGRQRVEAQMSFAKSSGWPSQCKKAPDLSKYMAYFPATTNLDEATVAGLKPGQGRKKILEKFPDALITPIVVGEARTLFGYLVKRGSLQNPPRLIMYTAPDHRIFRIGYMENVTGVSAMDDLEKKYTSLYGPPDTRRVHKGLRLEYRQPGRQGKFAKTLTIDLHPFERKKSSDNADNADEKLSVQVRISIEDVELRDWTSAHAASRETAGDQSSNATQKDAH